MKKPKIRFHTTPMLFCAYCIICLSLSFHSPTKIFAQEFDFQREVDTIPVIENGTPLPTPFAGGCSYSKPSICGYRHE